MKKVVVKVELHDEKAKQKALKAVSGLSGVESISMDMKDKKLTVIGNVDPVQVVIKLRKVWPTEIVSVGENKKEEPKKAGPKKEEGKNTTKNQTLRHGSQSKGTQHRGEEHRTSSPQPQPLGFSTITFAALAKCPLSLFPPSMPPMSPPSTAQPGAGRRRQRRRRARASLGAVQFHDLYGFVVEGDVEDVNVLNEVRERVREQGRVYVVGHGVFQGRRLVPAAARRGQVCRPFFAQFVGHCQHHQRRFLVEEAGQEGRAAGSEARLSLSWAAKKRSTVPESYYEDLTMAVAGQPRILL